MREAWRKVKGNDGSPGVDGMTFEDIQASQEGVEGFLEGIIKELRERTYRASAVKRTYIPKADGSLRPLGIPIIKDRVIQMAVLLIIEPIFEADFLDCSYGFRPERNAHQAIEEIQKNIKEGREAIYDLDMKKYFDTIPHDNLMKCIRMRIVDSGILKLIKQWLEAVLVEKDENNKPKYNKPKKGTPQGGVISPLLANLYLHWFDKIFLKEITSKTGAKLIRYADDVVVMARYMGKTITEFIEQKLESWMKLEINQEKTKILKMNEDKTKLNFLGFSIQWTKDRYGRNKKYLNITPSDKAIKKECLEIYDRTDSRKCFKPITQVIGELNIHLKSWANYFRFGYPRKAFRKINSYVRLRLTKFLQRRSQRPMRPPKDVTYYEHLKNLGLVYL